jgi:hypothetical protein
MYLLVYILLYFSLKQHEIEGNIIVAGQMKAFHERQAALLKKKSTANPPAQPTTSPSPKITTKS